MRTCFTESCHACVQCAHTPFRCAVQRFMALPVWLIAFVSVVSRLQLPQQLHHHRQSNLHAGQELFYPAVNKIVVFFQFLVGLHFFFSVRARSIHQIVINKRARISTVLYGVTIRWLHFVHTMRTRLSIFHPRTPRAWVRG